VCVCVVGVCSGLRWTWLDWTSSVLSCTSVQWRRCTTQVVSRRRLSPTSFACFAAVGLFVGRVVHPASHKSCTDGDMCTVFDHWGLFSDSFLSTVIFTARRNARVASAVLTTAIPSVRPSHAGIVSKRRHVARCSLHCWIAKCV